jgi:hypothetical protein
MEGSAFIDSVSRWPSPKGPLSHDDHVCYVVDTVGGCSMAKDGKRKHDPALELQLLHERNRGIAKIVDTIGIVLRHGLTMACIFGVAYEVRQGLVAIAGTTTTLNSNVTWAISISIAASIAWGAIATIGWVRERRLRKQFVGDTAPHIARLEAKLDPNRQSSGLSPTGETARTPAIGEREPGGEKQ